MEEKVISAYRKELNQFVISYVKKSAEATLGSLLFEPNDQISRGKFIQITTRMLQDVQSNFGIYDYFVKCDETLNTNEVVDNNEFKATIGIYYNSTDDPYTFTITAHKTRHIRQTHYIDLTNASSAKCEEFLQGIRQQYQNRKHESKSIYS